MQKACHPLILCVIPVFTGRVFQEWHPPGAHARPRAPSSSCPSAEPTAPATTASARWRPRAAPSRGWPRGATDPAVSARVWVGVLVRVVCVRMRVYARVRVCVRVQGRIWVCVRVRVRVCVRPDEVVWEWEYVRTLITRTVRCIQFKAENIGFLVYEAQLW